MPSVRELAVRFHDAIVACDPERLSGESCAGLVQELASARKACEALEVRVAARAASFGVHRAQGFADVGDWLAQLAGSTVRQARIALETVAALDAYPDTADALFAGDVSLLQAGEIARTEREVPGSEHQLLKLARNASLGARRESARKRRVQAMDPEQLYAHQRARRSFTHWRDELGMGCYRGIAMPEDGIPFLNRIDAEADRIWREARRAGRAETRDTCAADAFARVVAGGGKGKAASADLVLVCDVNAYRRGHAHAGESSHIVGGGPIPPAVAREVARDAFLKVVLHDGVDIQRVMHVGRRIPAELRTALDLGAPSELDGVRCSEGGCDRRYGLQWDHADPIANGGVSSRDNLQLLCFPPPHPEDRARPRGRSAGR
jgi:Domain of unknown function (DUF222)